MLVGLLDTCGPCSSWCGNWGSIGQLNKEFFELVLGVRGVADFLNPAEQEKVRPSHMTFGKTYDHWTDVRERCSGGEKNDRQSGPEASTSGEHVRS